MRQRARIIFYFLLSLVVDLVFSSLPLNDYLIAQAISQVMNLCITVIVTLITVQFLHSHLR